MRHETCPRHLGAVRVLERHGEARNAEEVELIGDRVKHRRDKKRDERHLNAGSKRPQPGECRIAAGPLLDCPRTAEAEQVQPDEQQEAGDPQVHGVLQIDVVNGSPCEVAARLIERDHVLADSDADNRVVRDHIERSGAGSYYGSADEMVTEMQRLCDMDDSERTRIGNAGRAYVLDNYQEAHVRNRLIGLVERVISEAAGD